MFAKKNFALQPIILIIGVLSIGSCRQLGIDSTPTALISPTPKSSVTNTRSLTKPVASPSPEPSERDPLDRQAMAAVDRQAYDTAIGLFERSLATSKNECHKKSDRAWIKGAQKAKAWKAKTLESYKLHGLTTTDQVISKDQKEVFDEGVENALKGYKCNF